MRQYYSINEFSKIIGVSAQTLRNWDKNGKLHPHHTSSSGYRYYSDDQIEQIKNINNTNSPNNTSNINASANSNRLIYGYCRVANENQKEDLQRQVKNMKRYMDSQGQPYTIVTDIGSGISHKMRGLLIIIKMMTQYKLEKMVIMYKDISLLMTSDILEYIASLYNCKIEVFDDQDQSKHYEQEELLEEFKQLVTIFGYMLPEQYEEKIKQALKIIIEESELNASK